MTQEEEIIQLANLFVGKLDDFHVDAVKEYVDHGENGLALEMLCDFLADSGINLTMAEYKEVVRIGVLLGLDTNDARFTYLNTW